MPKKNKHCVCGKLIKKLNMQSSANKKRVKITVGRYAGKFVDTLPSSYLRWLITQNFSSDILEVAKKKLEESEYNDLHINISRHAIDMFSKRFLALWIQSEGKNGDDGDGLATFIAKLAQEAWEKGKDVSKHRHRDDGVVKELDGIEWVFGVNPSFPEYHDVITVMSR